MTIKVDHNPSTKTVTISIEGKFDFNLRQEFKELSSYGESYSYNIDLGKTDYMDSSALGMLLLLRERVGNNSARIRLVNPTEQVRKILAVANFDKLFELRNGSAVKA